MSAEDLSGPDFYSPEMRAERLKEFVVVFTGYVETLGLELDELTALIQELSF